MTGRRIVMLSGVIFVVGTSILYFDLYHMLYPYINWRIIKI